MWKLHYSWCCSIPVLQIWKKNLTWCRSWPTLGTTVAFLLFVLWLVHGIELTLSCRQETSHESTTFWRTDPCCCEGPGSRDRRTTSCSHSAWRWHRPEESQRKHVSRYWMWCRSTVGQKSKDAMQRRVAVSLGGLAAFTNYASLTWSSFSGCIEPLLQPPTLWIH